MGRAVYAEGCCLGARNAVCLSKGTETIGVDETLILSQHALGEKRPQESRQWGEWLYLVCEQYSFGQCCNYGSNHGPRRTESGIERHSVDSSPPLTGMHD